MNTTKHGSRITRDFIPNSSRHHWDDFLLFKQKGWAQYDTTQDAWYFGVWVNHGSRLIVTYCEGDVTILESPDADTLKKELAEMAEFYGPPPPAAIYYSADGERTEIYDATALHGRELPNNNPSDT